MALSPGPKSFDELLLELEQEKKRWLEMDRKTKELELFPGKVGIVAHSGSIGLSILNRLVDKGVGGDTNWSAPDGGVWRIATSGSYPCLRRGKS